MNATLSGWLYRLESTCVGLKYYARIPAMEDLLKTNINLNPFKADQGRIGDDIYVSDKQYETVIELLWWCDPGVPLSGDYERSRIYSRHGRQGANTRSFGADYVWVTENARTFSNFIGGSAAGSSHQPRSFEWPSKERITFISFPQSDRAPFVVYANVEALMKEYVQREPTSV